MLYIIMVNLLPSLGLIFIAFLNFAFTPILLGMQLGSSPVGLALASLTSMLVPMISLVLLAAGFFVFIKD